MDEQSLPPEEDPTQSTLDHAQKLTGAINAAIARAVRLQANAQPVDARQVRQQAQQLYEQLLRLLPEEQVDRPVLLSPLELMASYWSFQQERKDMATTGFPTLNRVLSGGLERDRLYVLLGAPGSGKTTLANQMADALGRERAVLYVSSEDTPLTLLAKTIARRGTIDYSAVLHGQQSERGQIEAAFAEYRAQPQVHHLRYLDATQGLHLQEIAEQAAHHFEATRQRTTGDPIIMVDYLQRLVRVEEMLMRGAGGSLGADARQAATLYTERLRALACDLHCSVLCLSAMNRASGYSHAGSNVMSAAKESGDIEYTADVILALGEQQGEQVPVSFLDPGTFPWSITVAKNRQGMSSATGACIELLWRPQFQQFLEREYTPGGDNQQEGGSTTRYGRRRHP